MENNLITTKYKLNLNKYKFSLYFLLLFNFVHGNIRVTNKLSKEMEFMEITLNKAVYKTLVKYANTFSQIVDLKKEGEQLLQLPQDQVIESATMRATNWEFKHTVAEEITGVEKEISQLEKLLYQWNGNLGFDAHYLIESANPFYKVHFENYIVYKLHDEDGSGMYIVEHNDDSRVEKFNTKDEMVKRLAKEYQLKTIDSIAHNLRFV